MRVLRLVTLSLALVLVGCSSVPERIRIAPPEAPSLAQVRQSPEKHTGAVVRWGGTIAQVENRQGETRIELVARPLYGDGEPKESDASEGRFIAIIPGFLDPAIYASGRDLTVRGIISGTLQRKLGEMDYRYPLVKTEVYHLWPKALEYRDPYYYDPWLHDPWYPYPWHRYPYY